MVGLVEGLGKGRKIVRLNPKTIYMNQAKERVRAGEKRQSTSEKVKSDINAVIRRRVHIMK